VAYKSRNRVKAFRYLEILELDLILLRGSVAHPTYYVSPLRSSEASNDSSNVNLDENLLLGKEEFQCYVRPFVYLFDLNLVLFWLFWYSLKLIVDQVDFAVGMRTLRD